MLRDGLKISKAYAAVGTITERLRRFAAEYGISHSTFAKRRKIYMNNATLSKVFNHDNSTEDTHDRYRTCCFYCQDLITSLHELP